MMRRAVMTVTLSLLASIAGAQSNVEFNCASAPAGADDPAITTTTLAGIPAIIRVPGKVTQAPILLWHGFGPPDSEQQLMAALPLDDVPAVKVYLGLPMFGARPLPGGNAELVRRQKEDMATLVFEPAVMAAPRSR